MVNETYSLNILIGFYVKIIYVRKPYEDELYSVNRPLAPGGGDVFHTLTCGLGVFSDTVNHSELVRNHFTVK